MCVDLLYVSVLNNMDMIKISHVMTVHTQENHFVYVYNSVFNVYNTSIQ